MVVEDESGSLAVWPAGAAWPLAEAEAVRVCDQMSTASQWFGAADPALVQRRENGTVPTQTKYFDAADAAAVSCSAAGSAEAVALRAKYSGYWVLLDSAADWAVNSKWSLCASRPLLNLMCERVSPFTTKVYTAQNSVWGSTANLYNRLYDDDIVPHRTSCFTGAAICDADALDTHRIAVGSSSFPSNRTIGVNPFVEAFRSPLVVFFFMWLLPFLHLLVVVFAARALRARVATKMTHPALTAVLVINILSSTWLGGYHAVDGYGTDVVSPVNYDLAVATKTLLSSWGTACDIMVSMAWDHVVTGTSNSDEPFFSKKNRKYVWPFLAMLFLDVFVAVQVTTNIVPVNMYKTIFWASLVLMSATLTVGIGLLRSAARILRKMRSLKAKSASRDIKSRANAFLKRIAIAGALSGTCNVVVVLCFGIAGALGMLWRSPNSFLVFSVLATSARVGTSISQVAFAYPPRSVWDRVTTGGHRDIQGKGVGCNKHTTLVSSARRAVTSRSTADGAGSAVVAPAPLASSRSLSL